MGQIQENREKVASVVGAKLANEFSDDMLPAILHAIDGDEHEVRLCAQKATRPGVDNPATLMMWLLRERRHTELIPENRGGVVIESTAPPLPTPEELAARKKMMGDWKRIMAAIRRSQDLKMLYDALIDSEKPAEVRRQMIEAMDELNAAREART